MRTRPRKGHPKVIFPPFFKQPTEPALTPPSTYFHNQKLHWYCPDNAMPHNHLDEPELRQIHEFQTWHSRCHTHHDSYVNQSESHPDMAVSMLQPPVSILCQINLSA